MHIYLQFYKYSLKAFYLLLWKRYYRTQNVLKPTKICQQYDVLVFCLLNTNETWNQWSITWILKFHPNPLSPPEKKHSLLLEIIKINKVIVSRTYLFLSIFRDLIKWNRKKNRLKVLQCQHREKENFEKF